LIVDDEPLARDALKTALTQCEGIDIIGECHNGFEALKVVGRQKPDLVFLDIQMPKLDGFDVIELLGDNPPFIVFVTAYDEYALRAFEAQALDYLLKPVRQERLQQTLERVFEQMQLRTPQSVNQLIRTHRNQSSPLARILVRDGLHVYIIPVEDIFYIEAQDDYVNIVTMKKSYLKHERLNRLEEILDSQLFCRIHRSYIVNVDFLNKIEPLTRDSRMAVLKNGVSLPVSRSGYQRLMKLI